MKRREFIAFMGGSALGASTVLAHAQAPTLTRRVGVLIGTKQGDPEGMARLETFTKGLSDIGWVEGRNIRIDVGWLSGDANLSRTAAAEMVALKPDVIFAATTPVVAFLKSIAGPIPIVFGQVSDPIGSGFVQSLARPGGNITGVLNFEASLVGKWLEILVALGVHRVTAIFNPETSNGKYYLDALNTAAARAGVAAAAAEVKTDDEIDIAIGKLKDGGGMIVMPDGFTSARRHVIIAKAAQHSVPAVYPYPYMATDGGLVAYGVDAIYFYRRAPIFVDRILKGEKPANLPTEQPTKFELVINLMTAKALGLEIPATLLARADEVIE